MKFKQIKYLSKQLSKSNINYYFIMIPLNLNIYLK